MRNERIVPQCVTVYCRKWVHQDYIGEDDCLVTDQVDASTSDKSTDCVHSKCEINHDLKQTRVLVTFGGRIILNDCDALQGVHYCVYIGAHEKWADMLVSRQPLQ